jgi:transketolase
LQALGHTREVIDIRSPAATWESFGWEAREVDGHDIEAVHAAALAPRDPRPRVIVARTVLGKGVPFMEDRLDWHYRNLTPELQAEALRHLDGEP